VRARRLGLWPHLMLVAAVGILVATGSVIYLGHRAASAVYAASLRRRAQGEVGALRWVLESAYLQGGMPEVRAVLPQLAAFLDGRIQILGPTGRAVLADSAPGQPVPGSAVVFSLPLFDSLGDPAAVARFILPNPVSAPFGPVDQSLARALLLPTLAGFGGALLISLILLRRVAAPLMALAAAARRFATGDLALRIPVAGPREVAELAAEFNRMAEALERAHAQQRALVADVAHELRTPLTVLRGYLEALRDGVVEPDQATIALIHAEAVHLQRLVEDLQDLAQADAAELRLELAPLEPSELLRAAAAGFDLQAEAKGIHLEVDVPVDLPPVRGDRRRLTQVVHNLLANALRYTPAGGRVTLSARADAATLTVAVADTGPGIAAEHLPFLFDRFYRVDPSRARETGGSGLGLTIAKRLVEAHGGTIGVRSSPGAGSTFWFTVPLWVGPAPGVAVGGAEGRTTA
jgi:two-component system sensor histidine kinase BaeS